MYGTTACWLGRSSGATGLPSFAAIPAREDVPAEQVRDEEEDPEALGRGSRARSTRGDGQPCGDAEIARSGSGDGRLGLDTEQPGREGGGAGRRREEDRARDERERVEILGAADH